MAFTSCISVSQAAADEDITISSNTTWVAGTYTYRDITVTNNATLTLGGTYTTDTNGTGVIINARSVTVNSGSTISATGQGYAANAGIGKGTNVSAYGGGGSHANNGGNHAIGSGGGTTLYGSTTAPTTLGSGGGNGGAGGGAIQLNLSGNLSLAGNIYAKGNNGGTNTGSGAGGSIYISAVDLSGAGNISVNGGSSGSGGGGGSGGRIMIYHTGTNSLTDGNITAAGGTGYASGGVGSKLIYNKTTKDVTIASDITIDSTMGIDENGDPSTDGIFHFNDLTINNNANLYSKAYYTTDTNGTGIELSLTGDLNVASGAKINGIGKGYAYQAGDGKPTGVSNTYGGGGAHGGNGGRGDPAGSGGTKYDSTLFPVKPGSGGYTTRGGAGGSAVKITASAITVDGSIDQSGAVVVANASNNGGGGAGGSVYVVADSLSGAGTIKADGTNGYGYSGGGGGGRIAIYADTSGFNTNNITAAKGIKGGSGLSADGDVGTIFLYDTASGNVSASSDVTFNADQGVSRDGSARTDGVFYFNNLTVTNNATVTIGGYYTDDTNGRGVTINLDGSLTIDSGSTVTASGQGYTAGAGPGKGSGGSSTSGSGGSYGGVGGQSYNNNLAPAVYGTTEANFPYKLGSSGGAGDQVTGPAGGGAVTFRVLGNIVNNGTISADGSVAKASPIPGWYTGGGSGGSVFLVCNTLSGSGTITAKGGNGAGTDYGSGGGGGGRISVVYSTSQNIALGNFSASGGTGGGGVSNRNGAEGSVNITQKVLPAAEFTLKNPNNDSTQFTNTENVEIVPTDETVEKYKEAASVNELVPAFYADGWANITDGKDVGASEGAKTVRAWFKDSNELISSSVGSATITLDKTQPDITISNNNQSVSNASTTVQLDLSDNTSGIDYLLINGQRVEVSALSIVSRVQPSSIKAYADNITYEATVSLAEGENSIPIVVYDKAGNSTQTTFIATRTTPVVPSPTPTPVNSSLPSSSATSTASSSGESSSSVTASGSSTDSSETTEAEAGEGLMSSLAENIQSATEKIADALNPFSNKSSIDESENSGLEKSPYSSLKIIILIILMLTVIFSYFVLKNKK